jgi:hypothetical protein
VAEKLIISVVVVCVLSLFCRTVWADDGVAALPLEDVTDAGVLRVPFHETRHVTLPPLPAKPGKVIVLRFGAVAYSPGPAGCNYNMTMAINGAALSRFTNGGEERLVGREPSFRFTTGTKGDFQVFSGPRVMLMYAPDIATGNTMSTDGLGATFVLDISDLASGVDGNTLTVTNTRPVNTDKYDPDVLLENVQVGQLDRELLPKPDVNIPQRGEIARQVTVGKLSLAQGAAGGFSAQLADGVELLVETGMGMDPQLPSQLLAQDELLADSQAAVEVAAWGANGFRVTATWPTLRLSRTIELRDNLVHWKECWTNTSDTIAAVPFRHQFFLRDGVARFRVGGDPDAPAMAGSPQNPTLFVQSLTAEGNGAGITAESDWLRLLMALRTGGGIGELYSETLALPAGGSIDFDLSITPVADGGGYWSFINSVRRRWGVNGVCLQRPIFWGYARASDCPTPEETLRRSLGHLGPIVLATGGWLRLTADRATVCSGNYPKLPTDAPRTPGETPDLDVESFITLKHRDTWWQQLTNTTALIHKTCPQVEVIHMTHPAMEVVYEPMAERFPIAAEVIRMPAGEPFEVYHYSRAHLGAYTDKGWRVYYYSPRPGSTYLTHILRSIRRSMDEAGSDGIYCDEFSWAGRSRGYSRYDYSRWDGYSADIEDNGQPVRLKCDNAYVSESCQLRMTHEALRRGKLFLGNGAASLRSINSLPVFRFIEGGNGHGTMANGHLSCVPLVLGNMGDQKTQQGVFESVKQCLSIGCIYSPTAVNLLLKGADNFVCKLYPLTIRELGAGCVKGEERLITTASGSYHWPGREATVRFYTYDANGDLLDRDKVVAVGAGDSLPVEVLPEGLTIAEVSDDL